ncbi:MAG: hypothetical protein PHY02_09735 [Phycisphaerae bacterium]|nr:hypothetical protein [Phycisphaerae bacterium]
MGTEGIWIPLLIGAAAATPAIVSATQGGTGGSGGFSMPSAKASQAVKTAAAPANIASTEQEKMNKRLAASMLTKDWGGVKLSKPGLLGLGV